jgi:hypothetical protein
MHDYPKNCPARLALTGFGLAAALHALNIGQARAAQDVLLQTMGTSIVTGTVDDQTNSGTLGSQVHSATFLSNFRAADPGFVSFAHGNFNMPPGAEGFPALHNVNFDLLPMTVGQASANLLYWNGADLDANGLSLADVAFAPPTDVLWQVLDANSNWYTADGSDQFVPGGLIQRTSSDIDPLDGVNSGAMHKHLVLQLADLDGDIGTTPAQGLYMVCWQVRATGFDASEPFLFVHRTSGVPTATLNVAVEWAEANYDALTAPLLPGDFDLDGQVDGNDFLTWQRTLGTPAASALATWREAMATGGATVAAVVVPEPAAAALVLVALAAARNLARRTAQAQLK